MRTLSLTLAAMIAFAANSILCRLALGTKLIDPVSFTGIRLLSGAAILVAILWWQQSTIGKPKLGIPKFDLLSSAMLFVYATSFSYAYIELATGTGALILFGMVQLTMILYGLFTGERPKLLAWIGMAIAVAGLIYLLLPGVSAPPPDAALLMAAAGIAWGIYSLRGRGAENAVASTTWNFVGTIPLVIALVLYGIADLDANPGGIILAILSGALASGVGYAIWYAALPHLSPTRAANVQLSVPVIAAFGGVFAMGENITVRLIIASTMTLGGIALVIMARNKAT